MGSMVDEDQCGERGHLCGRLLCAPMSGTSRRKGAVTRYSWHELVPVLADGELEPGASGENHRVHSLVRERPPRNPVVVLHSIRREKRKTARPQRWESRRDGLKEEQHE